MEVVLMILTLPLMMAGGFLLDGLTQDADAGDVDEDIAATHQPETDDPPII